MVQILMMVVMIAGVVSLIYISENGLHQTANASSLFTGARPLFPAE